MGFELVGDLLGSKGAVFRRVDFLGVLFKLSRPQGFGVRYGHVPEGAIRKQMSEYWYKRRTAKKKVESKTFMYSTISGLQLSPTGQSILG